MKFVFPWKVQYYGACCNEGLDQGHSCWEMQPLQDQLCPFFIRVLCLLCQPCSSYCVITVWQYEEEKQNNDMVLQHLAVCGYPIRLREFSLFCICLVMWLSLSLVHRPVFLHTKHQRMLHSFGIRACPTTAFVRTHRQEPACCIP